MTLHLTSRVKRWAAKLKWGEFIEIMRLRSKTKRVYKRVTLKVPNAIDTRKWSPCHCIRPGIDCFGFFAEVRAQHLMSFIWTSNPCKKRTVLHSGMSYWYLRKSAREDNKVDRHTLSKRLHQENISLRTRWSSWNWTQRSRLMSVVVVWAIEIGRVRIRIAFCHEQHHDNWIWRTVPLHWGATFCQLSFPNGHQ